MSNVLINSEIDEEKEMQPTKQEIEEEKREKERTKEGPPVWEEPEDDYGTKQDDDKRDAEGSIPEKFKK